jgi:hypothetical protein
MRKLLQKFFIGFRNIFYKFGKSIIKDIEEFNNKIRKSQNFNLKNYENNSLYILFYSFLFFVCVQNALKTENSPRDSIVSTASTVRWGGTRRKLKTRRKFKYTRR